LDHRSAFPILPYITSEDEHDRYLPRDTSPPCGSLAAGVKRSQSHRNGSLETRLQAIGTTPLQQAQAMNDAIISIPLLLHTVIRRNTQSAL
jgi:hypothetical protein